MADVPEPELELRIAVAQLLHEWELAVYQATGALPEGGINLDGTLLPKPDSYTVLTSPKTIYQGRADAMYRVQIFHREVGTRNDVEAWSGKLFRRLDHREYLPNILGIGLAEETSRAYFDPDTQMRSSVASTYAFHGRRQ